MQTNEDKILAHIELEWEKFCLDHFSTHTPSTKSLLILKTGFYAGFKAGVCAMHDADKIL